MKKFDIVKLSDDVSRLKKMIKLSSFAAKLAKALVALTLIFTAADTFLMLKKA